MLRCAERRHAQGMPYLWNVSFAGYDTFTGFKFYERRCLESLTAIFAPKFPQLPEELIPTIVRYAFHPGMYASSGVPEHHGRQPFPYDLKPALERLASVLSLRRLRP